MSVKPLDVRTRIMTLLRQKRRRLGAPASKEDERRDKREYGDAYKHVRGLFSAADEAPLDELPGKIEPLLPAGRTAELGVRSIELQIAHKNKYTLETLATK